MFRRLRSSTVVTQKTYSPKIARDKQSTRRRFSLPEKEDSLKLTRTSSNPTRKTVFAGSVPLQAQNEGLFEIHVDECSTNGDGKVHQNREQTRARRITSSVNDESLLHFAVSEDDIKLTQSILDAGKVNVDCIRPPGVTALHQACVLGHLECVKVLVMAGADLRKEDWLGRSPTKLAVTYGHYEVAEFLLQHGSTIKDIKDGFQSEKTGKMKEKRAKGSTCGNALKVPSTSYVAW